jgi:hypothetical protein
VKVLLEKYADLKSETRKEEIILTIIDDDKNAKAENHLGGCCSGGVCSNKAQKKECEQKGPLINVVDEVNVPAKISYLYLKYRLLQCRINKAIGMNGKAHDIVNSIIMYVKRFQD